jgi:hypothetical protein
MHRSLGERWLVLKFMPHSACRVRVYTNNHAERAWQGHGYVCGPNDPITQSLLPGKAVGLYLIAK